MVYRGEYRNQISFPLGGIGSGCIGLSGTGRLIDFEIFNHPNKKSLNGYSGFCIKAEADGKVLDARILNGDYPEPYMGERYTNTGKNGGFGFGPSDKTLAGLPHFADNDFRGEFPVAQIEFVDWRFPAKVRLKAFNPLIPLDDKNSSIPGAFFEVEIKNITAQKMDYTTAFFFGNPFPVEKSLNRVADMKQGTGVTLTCKKEMAEQWNSGDITIATDCKDAAFQEYWYRGGWRDNIEMFWEEFTELGLLKRRSYKEGAVPPNTNEDTACIEGRISLQPGECETIRFLVTWNFPWLYNFWNEEQGKKTLWRNYYATLFSSSEISAEYGLTHWNHLYQDTEIFTKALYSTTIPQAALDAIGANLSVLKSPTVLRLEDGTFYGFEGCLETEGSCEGSCTHVWNYAYSLPYLFPALERSMREADYRWNQREDGRMSFRLMLPLGRERVDFSACVDGQMGGIIKTYRDWKMCGDDDWLKRMWPKVKKSLEYAWAASNEDQWDMKKMGVISGRQHHTLDMELYGPNSWLTGFYLAALDAGARMAEYLNEPKTAEEYREIRKRGIKWVDEHLFFGTHFGQKADLHDKSMLNPYSGQKSMLENPVTDAYWNEERGEIKYQIGKGCHIDQVVAQWHCNLCGLGEIFEKEKVKTALKNLYEKNYIVMRQQANVWRNFALNDEEGLVICTWEPGEKPVVPLTYSTECMTGFEYQAACHMIQEGLEEEGLAVIRAVRNRYDGKKRNPWNEFECGSNYARSMASYSLLPSYSGFCYDARRQILQFAPKTKTDFKCFWSTCSGWGSYEQKLDLANIRVLYGELHIKELLLSTQIIIQDIFCTAGKVEGQWSENHAWLEKTVVVHGEDINIIYKRSKMG